MGNSRFLIFVSIFALGSLQTSAVKVTPSTLTDQHFRLAMSRESEISFQHAPGTNVSGYSRFPLEVLGWLSAKLKFTYTIVLGEYVLQPLPNGTWPGGYGLLQKKEVDFFFAPLPLIHEAHQLCDFTATLFEAPLVMLVPSPKEENRISAIIEPFSLSVWLLIIGFAICIILAVRLSSSIISQVYKQGKKLSFRYLVLCNLRLIFGQGGFEGTLFRSVHARLALSGWLLSLLVLVNCYAGIFISHATVPSFKNEIKTVEDAAYKSDLVPLVTEALPDSFFRNGHIDTLTVLAERIVKNREIASVSLPEVGERVNTGCCFFIFPEFLLEAMMFGDFKKTGECRCRITRAPIMWDFIAFATQKGNPYSTVLSKEILFAKEMGLLHIWEPQSVKRSYKCTKLEPPKVRPLTMTDLRSPFILLGIGALLSFVVLVLEKFAANVKNLKPDARKHEG